MVTENLGEKTEIGQRTLLPDGQIWVRTDTIILRDGVEIARTFHRHVVEPGDDLTLEDASVSRIASVEHTPETIRKFKEAQAAQRAAVLRRQDSEI